MFHCDYLFSCVLEAYSLTHLLTYFLSYLLTEDTCSYDGILMGNRVRPHGAKINALE